MKNSTFLILVAITLIVYSLFGDSVASFIPAILGCLALFSAIICDSIEKINKQDK